jgi:arylsulfatase A
MQRITRRSFIGTAGAGAAGLAAPAWLQAAGSRKPNIVFLLSDDVGIDLMSCYGSDRFKTPNIDALAKGGIRFETCHSAPLCGPTRCEFLTGRYAFRTGGLTNQSWSAAGGQGPKSGDEVSIAKLLKQAGYATCSSGKFRQVGETPGDWGFDEWLTDPTAGGWYWQKTYTKNGQLIENDKEVYCPDVAHEFAMDFVRRHSKEPFFLYYPTHLVHGPILRTPDSAPDSKDLYADNVAYLDKSVGKVVAEIERLGLSKDTVIVFSGDNGTARESGTVRGRQINGAKGSMWEGGTRVPLIASWKGTTPRGKVLKDMVDFSDFYATFAELAGAKLPAGVTVDGRSFAPQLRGRKGNPREWIYVQLGRNWYVKEPGWKLNQGGELYDMKEAPFVEKLVPAGTEDAAAAAGRKRLQAVLDKLNPAGGKTEAVPQGAAGKAGKKAGKGGRKKKVL